MPVVVITPTNSYYEASVRGETVNEDKIDRLVNQVSLKTRSRSFAQRVLGNQDDKSVTDAKVDLSTYEVGERMVVMKVEFKDADVLVTLGRTVGRKPQAATGFRVRLDHKIADPFPEEAQVLQLIEQAMAVGGN